MFYIDLLHVILVLAKYKKPIIQFNFFLKTFRVEFRHICIANGYITRAFQVYFGCKTSTFRVQVSSICSRFAPTLQFKMSQNTFPNIESNSPDMPHIAPIMYSVGIFNMYSLSMSNSNRTYCSYCEESAHDCATA